MSKNKNNKHVISIETQLNLNQEEISVLDAISHAFCSYKYKMFANFSSPNPLSEKEFRNKYQLFDRRYSRSCEEDLQGLMDSIQSNRKNYIQDKQVAIKKLKAKINKLSKKYYNSKKNNIELDKDFTFRLSKMYGKRDRLESELESLKNDSKNNQFSLCFGSKKLFKKQFNPTVSYQDWLREWREKRYSYFRLTGAKDENCGNSNVQMRLTSHNNFNIKLRVPTCLESQYGKQITLSNISFPYQSELIQNVVLANSDKLSEDRKPLSFMFKKHKQGYKLIVNIELPSFEQRFGFQDGVIAVDMNADNFAISDIGKQGNLISTKLFRFNLNNKTSNQINAILEENINKIVDYAIERKRNIVIEHLDFKAKKRELSENNDPKYAKMLSSFAYLKMVQQFKSRCHKMGILLQDTNPAYTSMLGKIKYAKKHGISNHQAAAYVIGRRFLQFKEKVKKDITILYKGKAFMLHIPARICNAQGIMPYNKVYKWLNDEMKAIGRRIPISSEPILSNSNGHAFNS